MTEAGAGAERDGERGRAGGAPGEVDAIAVGGRIDALLEGLRSSAEPRTWVQVEELVRLVTELYGAGLARVLPLVDPDTIARLAGDDLVGSLLVLHGLHPDSLAVRAERAVAAVAPTLRKGGAEAALTSVDAGTGRVVVTVTGAAGGCGSTGEALRSTVRDAVAGAVPDAESVEVRLELDSPATPVRLGRKPVAGPARRDREPLGVPAAALPALDGEPAGVSVSGRGS